MKRLTILLFIAILTFVAVLYVKRPDMLSHVWLWLVGLGAPIIGFIKKLSESSMNWFREKIQHKPAKPDNHPSSAIKP